MSSNQSRIRSRWGDRAPTAPRNNGPPRPDPLPSSASATNHHLDDDDLAMAALLNDANAKQQAQEQHHRPRGSSGRDGRDANRHSRDSSGARTYEGKRIVEDDDEKRGKNRDDRGGSKRRRRWNDRDSGEDGDNRWGSSATNGDAGDKDGKDDDGGEGDNPDKIKPDFGLSGALAKDSNTGNVVNGITLKFSEPPEARIPNTRWRLYVFRRKSPNDDKKESQSKGGEGKDDDLIDIYHISRQSSYLFGRERKVADIPVDHASLSKQHAVLQYRALPTNNNMQPMEGPKLQCKPYLLDLESTNGTFINGVRIDPARYYELRRGDVITLGASTREYVLLTEQSAKTGI